MVRYIVITQDQEKAVRAVCALTEYAFNSNIKAFLRDLLTNPVTAQPSEPLAGLNFTRERLLKELSMLKMIEREEKISDEDMDGNPKTAKMIIKYKVPKRNFNRKLRRLYTKLIESSDINECDCGGCMGGSTGASSSGQYAAPLFVKPLHR